MSNMKRWLRENGISYRKLASQLQQTAPSISQKVNLQIRWSYEDLFFLRQEYGLSADFVNDFVPYEELRDVRKEELV